MPANGTWKKTELSDGRLPRTHVSRLVPWARHRLPPGSPSDAGVSISARLQSPPTPTDSSRGSKSRPNREAGTLERMRAS